MSFSVQCRVIAALVAVAVVAGCDSSIPVVPDSNGDIVDSNGLPSLSERTLFPFGRREYEDPYDYASCLMIGYGNCSQGADSHNDLPENFDCTDFCYSDFRDEQELPNPINPQEFFGVRGPGVNRAWQVSTGRPDVVIAVIDSGIRWDEDYPGLTSKYYLNRRELPLPETGPNFDDVRFAGYDVNGDGAFNVFDYESDSRVVDLNGNGVIDPEDLIRTFSDGNDDDGNGYVDDISGWDFFENDNNPQDDTDYGHGTWEALWSGGQAGEDNGMCPNCMVMPLRAGDSFIVDGNHFAQAAVYAVDRGASVIQEALGSLNHTSFAQAAIDYAYENGVFVAASAADEAAAHHNWPGSCEHTTVMNSIRSPVVVGSFPHSYLMLNGCTNFGGHTFSSIPSKECSSEATGRAAGIAGLLVSAARNAVERGSMTNYITDEGTEARFPLSAEEQRQLWRLSCDDIDFSTPDPFHQFSQWYRDFRPRWWDGLPLQEAGFYALAGTLIETERYHTVAGWDYFTGYGRINAARLLRFIGHEGVIGMTGQEYLPQYGPFGVGDDSNLTSQDRIPPEADISSPRWWQQLGYANGYKLLLPQDEARPDCLVIEGRAAANRVTALGGTFDYVLEYAPHAQGPAYPQSLGLEAVDSEEMSAGPWTEVFRREGLTEAVVGELGSVSVANLAEALAACENPFSAEADPTSPFAPEQYAVRIRLRVIAHPVNPFDTVNNEAVHQKQIDVYPAQELLIRNDLGVNGRVCGTSASPSFADLDGDGKDELVVPTDDGLVHAYTDLQAGTELPGWPVATDLIPGIPDSGINAYTRGDVDCNVHGSILFGSAVAADLDDDGTLELAIGDLEGKLYAWQYTGKRYDGFPVRVDYEISRQTPCGKDNLPFCDDYEGGHPKRNRWNARDWAINSAPAVGDVDPDYQGLELVVGCSDGHVYAWHADGSSVDGWPVVLRDPKYVAKMDSATRFFQYTDTAHPGAASKIVVTPSIGDLDGDGDLEIVIGVNEQYNESMNLGSSTDQLLGVLDLLQASGNTRLYALHHTGTVTPESSTSGATPHIHDQAYCDGWPAPIAMLVLDLLPYMGGGYNTQSPLADVNTDGFLETITASIASPMYVLNADATSFYGSTGRQAYYQTGRTSAGDFGALSCATDGSEIVVAGGLAVGSMREGEGLTVVGATAGLRRAVDLFLDGRQLGSEDHLSLWNALTGEYELNAPIVVNDMQFATHPIIADINSDGFAEAIQGTAVSDLVAVSVVDECDGAMRFHTGGWQMGSTAIGTGPEISEAAGNLWLASVTREGYLRVFPTNVSAHSAAASDALSEWPVFGHDSFNSGNYHTDAERPYPLNDLHAKVNSNRSITLTFTASGDDRFFGVADHYEVRARSLSANSTTWHQAELLTFADVQPGRAGSRESIITEPLPYGNYEIMLRAYDESGNGSAIAKVAVVVN